MYREYLFDGNPLENPIPPPYGTPGEIKRGTQRLNKQ
jgi:hypothetical protein